MYADEVNYDKKYMSLEGVYGTMQNDFEKRKLNDYIIVSCINVASHLSNVNQIKSGKRQFTLMLLFILSQDLNYKSTEFVKRQFSGNIAWFFDSDFANHEEFNLFLIGKSPFL